MEERKADTLAGAFWQALTAPVRNFRNLRNLRNVSEDEETLFWALRDVSFEVKEGEVLGIIGHNGAGKSTLLKILSRITEPTEGRITIHGRVSSLLEVGTGFHPDLTGRENIYMNGTILGMRKKEIDSKLEEIIAFSGISRHIDTPVKRYSSGMTVRLAFSVAAHLDPEILVIDEVLAVGDMEFQKKCLGKMESVAKQGRTVLFVSHNMTAVSNLCSRVIWLSKGCILKNGSTSSVISDYIKGVSGDAYSSVWRASQMLDKKIYFKEVKLLTHSGDIVKMGEDLTFNLLVSSIIESSSFQICIQLFDSNLNRLTTLYNTDFNINFNLLTGDNKFSLTILNNNLLPGEYYFSFSAMYNYGAEIFDHLEKAIYIKVLPEDVTETGITLNGDRGNIWFRLK
ncbi:MAG: polysaccharide ABC transporter ATP-binding protein [Flammeovirgaceae bacterium]|nr:polysaccharide ABC transporter ATP-binding protein [Flammeovirgaceae bacterium]